jgi:deoxycytidine triphosphate deaminase/intein/homing endonuclease
VPRRAWSHPRASVALVILSDRSIREEIAAGRIVIDPLDESAIQPSSIDVHIDRFFRVFLNHTRTVIDVKEDLRDLTQEVEIDEDGVFILHPGEFVLGSTREVITLPDDLVSRIEGKSSLARLGLLIHSSLPGSEPVMVLDDGRLVPRPIEEVVRKQQQGFVVAFDPETFEVGYHAITGWYEGPPDTIFEVELASGRTVRVTAGHNLFTIDRDGDLAKVRTGQLVPGMRVAVPRRIPDPADADTSTVIRVLDHVPDPAPEALTVGGPAVARVFEQRYDEIGGLLRRRGLSVSYHRRRERLPFRLAREVPGLLESLGAEDWFGWRGGRNRLPARIDADTELAWLLGLYVAEGYRRKSQVVVSNTDQAILDRVERALRRLGLTFHRGPEAITVGSAVFSAFLGWMGTGGKAAAKSVPPVVYGWPTDLVAAFVDGVVDGDGSLAGGRTSVWTTSRSLMGGLLVLFARLGMRAGSCLTERGGNTQPVWQVYAPDGEHKLLTSIPLPDRLLVAARESVGLRQVELARLAGYRHATDLCNFENRTNRDAVRRTTLARLRDALRTAAADPALLGRVDRLVDGDLAWDDVVAVRDTGSVETIFDIEVRPYGRNIENFLAGNGGVFVSNTAGFIDPGFSGHITLELANVATLPITLYPGMKIGQISFMRMTTPADVPYGSSSLGSKYQGQRGPTPSRYFENFSRGEPAD